MALTEQQRADLHAESMQAFSIKREGASLTKTDLRAAVDALDNFLETNATAINNAIPQPARAALTAQQKARLLAFVALRRFG